MLNKISTYLADALIRGGVDPEDRDIYIYGWEMTLSTFTTVAAVLLMGILYKCFISTAVYLLCFLTIRAYAGGVHATTYFRCFLTSIVFYLIPLAITRLFEFHLFPPLIIALCLSGTILIYVLGPRDHPNKRLTDDDYLNYKLKSRIISVAWLVGCLLIVSLFSFLIDSAWWISVGIFQAGITLLRRNH